MREPRREEFHGLPAALYRTAAPASVKVSKAAEPRQFAAGELVLHAEGYPAAALSPLNGEAVYAKACALRRDLRQKGRWPDAQLIAASLGAPPALSQEAATVFVSEWCANPRPVTLLTNQPR
jgi:hypothetical protein